MGPYLKIFGEKVTHDLGGTSPYALTFGYSPLRIMHYLIAFLFVLFVQFQISSTIYNEMVVSLYVKICHL